MDYGTTVRVNGQIGEIASISATHFGVRHASGDVAYYPKAEVRLP